MKKDLKTRSKYLSLILRHDPSAGGIELDKEGWANVSDLIYKAGFTRNELELIVRQDDKQRYSFDMYKKRIRANQGHSLPNIQMNFKNIVPPEFLYHGTAQQYIYSIMKNGLNKQNRNYVHLSKDIDTATKVGSRKGKHVILKIHAKKMYDDGYEFLISANNVYLIEFVPSDYITIEY